ncbi:MAG: hypothetical protein QOI01_3098 [Mycobacterium sp.]|jgi:predicted ATPase|nr:hypothetical protein [Mycobacterium sp.]
MNPPSGVVTFLFTDIEGSTRRWETDADQMRATLAAHDEVLRKTIEVHEGWLFKHTGDGVCAAFDSPRAAVDAAIAAQRALELPVRMGIATGEAELRATDYFGVALNRAARVMAAGHGGQILLADSTASLLNGVDLLDLGLRRLRDLATPVGVFQVHADGLRRNFPPLWAQDPSPGNLRPPVTSFIGREAEVADVVASVRAHRLVTLTGVGGVGKTRLAVEVGTQLVGEFPDGIWLFELAAVSDPGAVPDAVASLLGITQEPGMTLTESVAAAQEGRVRLLVFDNCEHLLDAVADLVEAIVSRSTTTTILATSREGLGVAHEHLWPVPSLDVTGGSDSAAVALFVERACSVAPRFSTDRAGEAAAVVEICGRLDGIPLAIELAASRVSSMTASDVRDRLDQRFRLLVGSRRGLERHQTLRHAVAWSYDHLCEAEQELLERCSVFAGGFDLESACAVGPSDEADEFAILDLLDALIRKSLLIVDRSSDRARYSMLETIRQFADEQLVARGEANEARTAHALHFGGRGATVLALWDGPRQREAYDWFALEFANLRTAFRCATDNDDLNTAAPIAMYAGFLGLAVENLEPLTWAEELIEPAATVDHPRLGALCSLASGCWMTGRIEDAVRYADRARLELGRRRVRETPFGIEGLLGGAHVTGGRPDQAIEWYRAQLARGHDAYRLTRSSLVLSLVVAGRVDEATTAAEGIIEAAEASGNPYALSFALFAYGYAFSVADPAAALDALRRGLIIAQDSGNRANRSHLMATAARVEAASGDPLAAFDYLTLAIREYHDYGNTTNMRNALAILAVLMHRLGRHEPAATIAGFALNPFVSATFPEVDAAFANLLEVLGGLAYERLAREGKSMTTAAMARYAYEQIDLARAEVSGRD